MSTNFPAAAQYDAIVGDFTADHQLISAAIAAGASRIFVRDGTYVETADINAPDGTVIEGESRDGVVIDLSGGFQVNIDGSGGTTETAGTVSVTNGSTAVVGIGTTFTNLNPGDFIRLGDTFFEIQSITDNLNLVLVKTYQGDTRGGLTYIAQAMFQGVALRDLTISGATGTGLFVRAVKSLFAENLRITECLDNLQLTACGPTTWLGCLSDNATNDGVEVIGGVGAEFSACRFENNGALGIEIGGGGGSIGTIVKGCRVHANNSDGISVLGASNCVTISDSQVTYNDGKGVNTDPGTSICTVLGCLVNFNGAQGVDFDGATNSVVGCTIEGNGGNGVEGGDAGVVSNCHIHANTGVGINYGSGSDGTLSGNHIENNTSHGISIASGSDNTLIGNHIDGNTGNGILIGAGAATNLLVGNFLEGNAAGDLSDSSPTTRYGSEDPARTLFVSADSRFTSVAAAITHASTVLAPAPSLTAPVLILVGGLVLEAPYTIPEGIVVQGHGGFISSITGTTDNNADFITVAPGGMIRNMTIQGPTGAAFAAVKQTTFSFVPAFVAECVFTTFGIGMLSDGTGGGVGHPIIHSFRNGNRSTGGTHTVFCKALNDGNVTCIQTAFMSGAPGRLTDSIFLCDAGEMTLYLSICRNGSSVGVRVDNGGELRAIGHSFSQGSTAIQIDQTLSGGADVEFTGTTIRNTFTTDLLVNDTTATVLFQGTMNHEKISNVGGTSGLGLTFIDSATGESYSTKSASVGQPGFAATQHVGEGAPTHSELRTYQYDASLPSGSRFTLVTGVFPLVFPTVVPQTADGIVFLVPRQFFGLVLDIGTAMSANGEITVEFWDGASYVNTGPGGTVGTGILVHGPAPALISRANVALEVAEEQAVTFNQNISATWVAGSLNGAGAELDNIPPGNNGFFAIRFRQSALPTTPVSIDEAEVIYRGVASSVAGHLFHGSARRIQSFVLPRWENAANSPANQDVGFSADVQVGMFNNEFVNGAVDQAGMKIPGLGQVDWGTPWTLEMMIHSAAGVPTGNFELELYFGKDSNGDIVTHGTTGPLAQQSSFLIVASPATQFEGVIVSITAHTPQLNADLGDALFIMLRRDATAGNVDDTANGNMVVRGSKLRARIWRSGESV